MAKFNLDDYETVKERKARFYEEYPDGRIVVNKISESMDYAEFKVYIYLNKEDQKENLPRSTGYALEIRDKELSVNKYGKEYESVNYSSWTENCEESAIGRALDNAGYSGNKKCSREEIEKAQRMNKTMRKVNNEPDWMDSPGAKKMAKILVCKEHGIKMIKSQYGDDYYHKNDDGSYCKKTINQLKEENDTTTRKDN